MAGGFLQTWQVFCGMLIVFEGVDTEDSLFATANVGKGEVLWLLMRLTGVKSGEGSRHGDCVAEAPTTASNESVVRAGDIG